ncbi:unnamed protein product, partial [Urochloa humidicola]
GGRLEQRRAGGGRHGRGADSDPPAGSPLRTAALATASSRSAAAGHHERRRVFVGRELQEPPRRLPPWHGVHPPARFPNHTEERKGKRRAGGGEGEDRRREGGGEGQWRIWL